MSNETKKLAEIIRQIQKSKAPAKTLDELASMVMINNPDLADGRDWPAFKRMIQTLATAAGFDVPEAPADAAFSLAGKMSNSRRQEVMSTFLANTGGTGTRTGARFSMEAVSDDAAPWAPPPKRNLEVHADMDDGQVAELDDLLARFATAAKKARRDKAGALLQFLRVAVESAEDTAPSEIIEEPSMV